MSNNDQHLTTETSITLLLCSNLVGNGTDAKSLGPSEFGWLLRYLEESGHVLNGLVADGNEELINKLQHRNINPTRLGALLDRGASIAVALENLTNSGIWVLSRLDGTYPSRLNERLGDTAPTLLYGVGDQEMLSSGGLTIVGSRDVDEAGVEFTRLAASLCAGDDITVISGGARGVDQVSMQSASADGGKVIGVLASNLAGAAVKRETRVGIMESRLCLVSPWNPNAGFNIGNAMGRNKHMYALGDWALVVSSDLNKGGTWSGATECLRSGFGVPVFVRIDDDIPAGNRELIAKGGIPVGIDELKSTSSLRELMNDKSRESEPQKSEVEPGGKDEQMKMFNS